MLLVHTPFRYRASFALSFVLLILSGTLSLWAGERLPAPVKQWMLKEPGEVVPLVQKDDFSCGYLALAAIYRSYGLDPELARLRERLGTSVPAIPFVHSTTGTLQPDLTRVLMQDGFRAVPIDPHSESGRLERHLSGPHLALALIKTERAGGFHWVVLTDYDDGSYEIADSLVKGLQRHDKDELLGPRFLQALLLSPGIPDPDGPLGRVHYEGSVLLWDSIPMRDKVLVLIGLVFFLGVSFLFVRWLLRRLSFLRKKNQKRSC